MYRYAVYRHSIIISHHAIPYHRHHYTTHRHREIRAARAYRLGTIPRATAGQIGRAAIVRITICMATIPHAKKLSTSARHTTSFPDTLMISIRHSRHEDKDTREEATIRPLHITSFSRRLPDARRSTHPPVTYHAHATMMKIHAMQFTISASYAITNYFDRRPARRHHLII